MADTQPADKEPQSAEELTAYVQTLVQTMNGSFSKMSEQILERIDDLGSRVDDLERSIGSLMEQAGVHAPEDGK